MEDLKKQNDMLVATISKADLSATDLLKNNLTLENTQLLSREEYKKYKYIQDKFEKDGKFDEELYNKYYDVAYQNYQHLDDQRLLEAVYDELEYSQSSFFRPDKNIKPGKSEYRAEHFENNPLQQNIGIRGDYLADPKITEREAAQSNRIWDTEKKKWLDETAESRNILQKAFGKTLVYAKYNKTGEQANPVTGKIEFHQAGEYIKDENGQYFTQTLTDQEIADGYEVVKLQDILSDEGSWWNQYDFFDSDGKTKSAAGVAAKSVVSLIPYLIPFAKTPYIAAQVLIGLGQNLPQFAKAINGWATNEKYTEFSKSCNQIVNYFSKFGSSMSDKGNNDFFSFESIAHQLTDTVHQLYTQRAAAGLATYIKKVPKLGVDKASFLDVRDAAKARAKWARSLGLAYMTLTQTGDIYQEALRDGFDARTAGITTLASAGALFGIMNLNAMTNLSTWFLGKGAGYDPEATMQPLAKTAKKQIFKFAKETDKLYKGKGSTKSWNEAWLKLYSKLDDIFRVGGAGWGIHMFTEGFEEVTEEAVQDGIKGIIDGLSAFGIKFGGDHQGSFGGWSNVFSQKGLERYLQTFIGGAMGGGVFHGIDVLENKFKANPSPAMQEIDLQLAEIALNEEGDEFEKQLKIASNFISDRVVPIPNADGTIDPTTDKQVNQRQYAVNVLMDRYRDMKALVDSFLEGSDFHRQDMDYKAMLKQYFLPQLKSTQAEEYLEKRFTVTLTNLVEGQQKIESLQKQIEEAQDTSSEELRQQLRDAKEAQKENIEAFKKYTSGKSYVDNFREAQWLTHRSFLQVLDKLEVPVEVFWENNLKPDNDSRSFAQLSDKEKERVTKFHQLFFDRNKTDLDQLVKQLPVIVQAFDNLSDFIKPGVVELIHGLNFHTVVKNGVAKMRQDYAEMEDQIKSLNYEEMLKAEDEAAWSAKSDQEKAVAKQERLDSYLQELSRSLNPTNLTQLIAQDPKSFTILLRYSMDYAKALQDAKIIDIDNLSINDKQKRLLKQAINNVFANSTLTTFDKEQVIELLNKVQELFNIEGPFKQLMNEARNEQDGGNWVLATLPNGDYDQFFEAKLKAVRQLVQEQGGLISDYYDELLTYYRNLDDMNMKIIQSHPNGEQILEKIQHGAPLLVRDIVLDKYSNEIDDSINKKLLKIPGITQVMLDQAKERAYTGEEDKVIDPQFTEALKQSISHAQQWEQEMQGKVTKNTFAATISQLAIALGADGKTAIKIGEYLDSQIKSIRDGEGDASSTDLPADLNDKLDIIGNVLNMVNIIINMASPVITLEGEEIRGMNKVRQEFFDAMGEDSSKVLVLTTEESEVLRGILNSILQKTNTLSVIQHSLIEDGQKSFEKVREEIIRNQYKLYCRLNANTDGDDLLHALDEDMDFNEELGPVDQWDQILRYRIALFEKFQTLKQNGMTDEQLIDRLFSILYKDGDTTIFQFGSDLVEALGINVEDDANVVSQTQMVLNDLVGVISDKCHPATIHNTIVTVLQELGTNFYPRQDQIYDLELALMGTLGKDTYSIYMKKLEKLYNENPIALNKKYIQNYIRIPGPAGSGKTALWQLYIKSLEKLGIKPEKVAATAHAEAKVNDLNNSVGSLLTDGHVKTIYEFTPKLQDYQALFYHFEQLLDNSNFLQAVTEAKKGTSQTIDIEKIQFKISATTDGIKIVLSKTDVTSTDPHISDIVNSVYIPFTKNETLGVEKKRCEFNTTKIDEIAKGFTPDIKDGVLMLDECTNLSEFEASILNQIALNNNVVIWGTGDISQEGYTVTSLEGKDYVLDDDGFLGLNAPALKSIYRLANSAQQNNVKVLKKLEEESIKVVSANSHMGLDEYTFEENAIQAIVDNAKNSKLQYTNSNTTFGFLGSLMTSDQAAFTASIQAIKDKGTKTILVIAPTTAIGNELKGQLIQAGFTEANISIIELKDVKGSEADYAIGYKIPTTGNAFSDLRRLNTLITRGRNGFIGLNNGSWAFDIKYEDTPNIHPIQIVRANDDLGSMWLADYKDVVDNLPKPIQEGEEGPPSESLPPTPEVDPTAIDALYDTPTRSLTNQTEDDKQKPVESTNPAQQHSGENESSKVLSNKISTSFTYTDSDGKKVGQLAVPIHTYGYRTGRTFDDLENKFRGKRLSEINIADVQGDNDFNAVIKLCKLSDEDLAKMSIKNKELVDIIRSAKSKSDYDVIDVYMYVINVLRRGVRGGTIKRIAFKVEDYSTDTDFPYLKPNDQEPNLTTIKRMGIPILDSSGNAVGLITLGTVGHMSYTTEQDALRQRFEGFFFEECKNTIRIQELSSDSQVQRQNAESFKAYQIAAGKQQISEATSGMQPYTAVRAMRIDASIKSNQRYFKAQLQYGRGTLKELRQMGWAPTGISKEVDASTNVDDFFNWYNQYRWGALSDDGKKQLSKLLTHKGKFIELALIGDPDQKIVVYVQHVTNWDTWFTNTVGKKAENSSENKPYISGYQSIFMLSALASAVGEPSTFNDMYNLVSDVSVWKSNDLNFDKLNALIAKIKDQTGIDEGVLNALKNSFILKAALEFGVATVNTIGNVTSISVINEYTNAQTALSALFGNKPGSERLKTDGDITKIITYLNTNKTDYAFTYVVSSSDVDKSICNYGFEPPHYLCNLDAYGDVQESSGNAPQGPVQVTITSEEGNGSLSPEEEAMLAAKIKNPDRRVFTAVITAIQLNDKSKIERAKNQLQTWAENVNNQDKPVSRQLIQDIASLSQSTDENLKNLGLELFNIIDGRQTVDC